MVSDQDLHEAFGTLPIRVQAVLALRNSGYTQQEVVMVLGISRTTVWGDERSGFETLRGILTDENEQHHRTDD